MTRGKSGKILLDPYSFLYIILPEHYIPKKKYDL